MPKLDVNFPLEPREEPWVKDLQDSKEMKQLLDSKIGKQLFIDVLGKKEWKNATLIQVKGLVFHLGIFVFLLMV